MLSCIVFSNAKFVPSLIPSHNKALKLAPKLGLNTLSPLLVNNQLIKFVLDYEIRNIGQTDQVNIELQ